MAALTDEYRQHAIPGMTERAGSKQMRFPHSQSSRASEADNKQTHKYHSSISRKKKSQQEKETEKRLG